MITETVVKMKVWGARRSSGGFARSLSSNFTKTSPANERNEDETDPANNTTEEVDRSWENLNTFIDTEKRLFDRNIALKINHGMKTLMLSHCWHEVCTWMVPL